MTVSDEIRKAKELIDGSDAVVIGAGAGLSTAAGFTYSGKRFSDGYYESCIVTIEGNQIELTE